MNEPIRCLVYVQHAERLRYRKMINSSTQLDAVFIADLLEADHSQSDQSIEAILVVLDDFNEETLDLIQNVDSRLEYPMVVFCDSASHETVKAAPLAGVTSVIVDGLSSERLPYILTVAMARHNFESKLRKELTVTRRRLEDRQILEKAKGLLMKQGGIDEETAYQKIRRLAMNENKSLGEVAKNLLSVADLIAS